MLDAVSDTLYRELRDLARRELRGERSSHTLSATALVHEALLRVSPPTAPEPEGAPDRRGTLLRVAAVAMRRVLVEHARARLTIKRSPVSDERRRVDLDSIGEVADLASESQCDVLLAFDDALTRLEAHSQAFAEVVRLRFFAGLTNAEVATTLGVSERTVNNHWMYARAWLARELGALE